MTTDATIVRHRPSLLAVARVVLALLTTATTALVAVWWSAIDDRFIARADDAGWDESLLLPHQMGLTLAIDGAVLLSAVLSVVSFLALLRDRRAGDPTT
jgi:hypothetical protein